MARRRHRYPDLGGVAGRSRGRARIGRHRVDTRARDPRTRCSDKVAQFEAVKRWFEDDWMRIEPKLRTSIIEGISVFLSLFDDNPRVAPLADGRTGLRRPQFGLEVFTARDERRHG